MPDSLKFRLTESPHSKDIARVEWLGASDHDARTVLAGPSEERGGAAITDAREWLRALLVLGPMPANDVYAAAAGSGRSERTIDRAKKALEVRSLKSGNRWVWTLPDHFPEQERQECQERQRNENGSLATRHSDTPTPGNPERHNPDQECQEDAFTTVDTLGTLELQPDHFSAPDLGTDGQSLCYEPGCVRTVAAGASYRCEFHIQEGH